ncbi:hypothetical protein MTR67_052044 [Solanum verrucosum]|uniref:Uncharacterized protein n=1 Tax=Solanum verrucosum TaxID=315347 RepID=A0AAF0V7B2_SOLVR|nr:hypothetical protein MTR67_052044 [Solanum verrucosum]
MAQMMTLLDILLKNVMGSVSKAVNDVCVSGVNPDDVHFEALYNEEANFHAHQKGDFYPSYPRLGMNQGWNKERYDGWRDCDREWRDRWINWKERDVEKERHVPTMSLKSQKRKGLTWRTFTHKICLDAFSIKWKGRTRCLKK